MLGLLASAPASGEVNLLEYPIRQPWTLLGTATVELMDDEPVIVCPVRPRQNATPVANVTVTVPPDTEAFALTASLRTDTLVPGKQDWHTARVVLAMLDADEQVLGYGAAVELHRNSGWVRQRAWLRLKPETRYVRVVAANHAQRGTAWFRDITLTLAPPVTAHPYEPGLPLGTFEYTHPQGFAKGWFTPDDGHGNPDVSPASEAGNTFLRVRNADAAADHSVGHIVELPPGQRMTVSVRVRSANLQRVQQEGWRTAMLRWHFLDAQGRRVGDWPDPPRLTQPTADWKTLTATASVPADARYVRLEPGLYHATGTADFDDIQITPAR